jgi:hypothetical protein
MIASDGALPPVARQNLAGSSMSVSAAQQVSPLSGAFGAGLRANRP